MDEFIKQLAICIERGKTDKESKYPSDMVGLDGASEITKKLLDSGIDADKVLKYGLMVGMNNIGEKFSEGKAFLPELLIAAKAMKAAMIHLEPYFNSGNIKHRGTFIVGTAAGDLHDIGKNIVKMALEGDGWSVIDLGTDVKTEQFLDTLENYPDANIGMSALLTSTMVTMEGAIKSIKEKSPVTKVFVGGAPLSEEFAAKIGADGYFPDPHTFVKKLAAI